jgi:integrase
MSKDNSLSDSGVYGMNLTRLKTGVYYYQRKIPLDLIEEYDGKKKFMHSLGTKDRNEALRFARLEGLKHDQEFESLRRNKEQIQTITNVDLQIIALNEANYYIEQNGDEIRSDSMDNRLQTVQDLEHELEIYMLTMTGMSIKNPNIANKIESMLERNNLPKKLPEDKLKVLIYHWIKNMLEVHKRLLREIDNPWDSIKAQSLELDAIPLPAIGEAVKSYLKDAVDDKVRTRNPKYLNRHLAAMRAFEAFFGPETKLKNIRFNQLKDLRNALLKFPTNVSKMKETRDLSIAEVYKRIPTGEFAHMGHLSANTINGYLQKVKEFFGFCERNDWVSKSPYDKTLLVPSTKKASERRFAFKPEHLRTIFNTHEEDPFRKWASRISVSMGLRLNDICQLERGNFKHIDDYLCIQVGVLEEQRVKTEATRRTLPIPQKLLDLGFEDWLESTPKKGNIWGLKMPSTGYYSDAISEPFGRWLTKLGIRGIDGKDPRTFHSFRHSYRDAFREKAQDIPKEVAEMLGGWTVDKDSVADSYGSGLSLKERKRYLDMLTFESF